MKKIKILIILVIITTNLVAQAQFKKDSPNNTVESKKEYTTSVYQIFPTQNRWNFIKLNTRNGKMWQVQYGMEKYDNFETELNLISLVTEEMEINGRFTLYPTQNIWNFILLDQINGNTWQVQWSMEAKSRVVFPISR